MPPCTSGTSKLVALKLIVDANIIFSALIKEGITAELLVDSRLELYSPLYVLDEIAEHKDLILRKTERQDITLIFDHLCAIINTVPRHNYESKMRHASGLSPDPDDTEYLALALLLDIPLWSNDTALMRQTDVEIVSTNELIALLRYLNPS